MKKALLPFVAILMCMTVSAQGKFPKSYLGDPVMIDSTSTVMIPVRYQDGDPSGVSKSLWVEAHYANFIFYNFLDDTYKKLFPENTFIVSESHYQRFSRSTDDRVISKTVFYRVRANDYDANGKIDGSDPAILYVSDIHGNGLQAITAGSENVVAVECFPRHDMALLKIQTDANGDRNFDGHDKQFYYVKLDLKTRKLGNKIELK